MVTAYWIVDEQGRLTMQWSLVPTTEKEEKSRRREKETEASAPMLPLRAA